MRAAAFFEIFQDAAIELVDILDAGLLHEDGGLFTANAAGAKAHDGFASQFLAVVHHGLWKLGELVNAPTDRALECAHVGFEHIARIQRHDRPALVVLPAIQPAL